MAPSQPLVGGVEGGEPDFDPSQDSVTVNYMRVMGHVVQASCGRGQTCAVDECVMGDLMRCSAAGGISLAAPPAHLQQRLPLPVALARRASSWAQWWAAWWWCQSCCIARWGAPACLEAALVCPKAPSWPRAAHAAQAAALPDAVCPSAVCPSAAVLLQGGLAAGVAPRLASALCRTVATATAVSAALGVARLSSLEDVKAGVEDRWAGCKEIPCQAAASRSMCPCACRVGARFRADRSSRALPAAPLVVLRSCRELLRCAVLPRRAYRLHYNKGQVRTDRFAQVGAGRERTAGWVGAAEGSAPRHAFFRQGRAAITADTTCSAPSPELLASRWARRWAARLPSPSCRPRRRRSWAAVPWGRLPAFWHMWPRLPRRRSERLGAGGRWPGGTHSRCQSDTLEPQGHEHFVAHAPPLHLSASTVP